MIIGYDAKRIFHNRSGLGNYGRSLILGLAKYHPDNNYLLYNPWPASVSFQPPEAATEIRPSYKNKILAQLWRRGMVAQRLKKDQVQLYHGLSGELPTGLSKRGIKQVVTIHDLIFLRFPKLYQPIDRVIYKRKALQACKNADLVVAVSQQTRQDLIDLLGIPAQKIVVIFQACAPFYWEKIGPKDREVHEKFQLPEKYALFVGTLEPRKNPVLLAKACLEKNINLILVGKSTRYWREYWESLNSEEQAKIRVIKVNSSAQLAAVYRQAWLFAYPSIFEGFGIPVLEAMASRVPLITGFNSALKEVAGPGSILVKDLNTSSELASALEKLWQEEGALRKQRIDRNWNYAQQFRDEVLSNQWIDTYQNLLAV
jgi:glycosyltransferase involved in cell wall biosynthesis